MQILLFIAYIILGLFQLTAINAGLENWFDFHGILTGPLAFFIAYIPIVGTVVGVLGAVTAWHWSWLQAGGLFFGPFVIISILAMSAGVSGKLGKAQRTLIIAGFFLLGYVLTSYVQDDELKQANIPNQKLIKLITGGHKVLGTKEKTLGPEHPDVAIVLINLGKLYNSLGDNAKAEPLLLRALAIREKALGPDHPDVANILISLGIIYKLLGNNAKAESLLLRALAITEKTLGPEHPDVAIVLTNLGVLYSSSGDSAKAEALLLRALAIMEKALGPDHPDMALTLNSLGMLYNSSGDNAKAESLLLRALAITKKALGPDHPDVAIVLFTLGMFYNSLGDNTKAEPLLLRSLAITEKALGPDHPDVAIVLTKLGMFYNSLGNNAKAEPLLLRSLAIAEKALGTDHTGVALTLDNLAAYYTSLGNYSKAEPLYRRSLAIMEKALGPDHPDVAAVLNNFAKYYDSLGSYSKAEPLLLRSLAIMEKALGPDHPDVAIVLTKLGMFYNSLGNNAKAEPLLLRSLAIAEKALGPDHPDVAAVLNDLATYYDSLESYSKAEPLYRRSLAIMEKALGPDHPDVAFILDNIGALYSSLGDNVKAEPLLLRSLAIKEKTLGPDHPDVAYVLNNLGEIYNSLGDNAKAEPLYRRSLAIMEKALGPDHPRVAVTLNSLGMLYSSLGDIAKAEPLLLRSLAITEKALGPDHPRVAFALNSLGMFYIFFSRNNAKVEPLLLRALAITKKALDPDHTGVSSILNNLALFYAKTDRYKKAYDLFKQAQILDEKLIERNMSLTSEKQKLIFLSMINRNMMLLFNLVNLHKTQITYSKKIALDIWLKRKGVILKAQKKIQEAIFYSDDPEAIKISQTLAQARSRLSNLTFLSPEKENTKNYKQKMTDIENDIQALEGKLSKISQTFALEQKISDTDSEKVANALPNNTALIEFVRIKKLNFKAKRKVKKWNNDIYLAFVLHAGKGDKPELIDLGDASQIDFSISILKTDINKKSSMTDILSRGLYDLVFAPLKNSLGDVTEIFISPDSNLNLIPFEILQEPDGKYLIENYQFNYLTAGRDLMGFGQIKEKAGKVLLIGDPDFDLNAEDKGAILKKMGVDNSEQRLSAKRSIDMRDLKFKRLPGTKKEVESIYSLFGKEKSRLYTGKNALEKVLKQKEPPSILHLATHGFFLTDAEPVNFNDDFQRGVLNSFSGNIGQPGKRIKIQNPLLRSGIALAGANNSLISNNLQENDGIVTAEKILGLNLRGTDMVVLSACATGLGEVKSGEGVYGLRRAFIRAGAKSIVMSMWSVPDKETQELMTEFYKNIIDRKMSRNKALRQAALKQMKITKERYGEYNPFYWGAFVFLGEP